MVGFLALVAFLVIGPDKVVGAIDDQLKGSPSPSPRYSLPSESPSPVSDATGTGLTSGSGLTSGGSSGNGSGTPVSEPTEEATPDGCMRGNQAIRSNLDTYGKASAASLSSLASNLDAAADDAGDSDVASAIRDLAHDARALSDTTSQFEAAINRNDTSQAEVYKNAFNSAQQEWKSDAETYKSVCS